MFYSSAKKNSFYKQLAFVGVSQAEAIQKKFQCHAFPPHLVEVPLADLPGADFSLAKSTSLSSLQCFPNCSCFKMVFYNLKQSE